MKPAPSALGLIVLAAAGGPAAAQDTRLSEALRQSEPCSGLTLDLGFLTLAVDRTRMAEVNSAAIDLDGTIVSGFIDGRIACETGPSSPISGDAGARVRVDFRGDLLGCRFERPQVRLSEFSGSFGDPLAALGGLAESALADAAEEGLRATCQGVDG